MNSDSYNNKGIMLSSVIVISLLTLVTTSQAQITPYCCAPPFVTEVVAPNILLSLDNSGSMYDRAYDPLTTTMSDTTSYYGYFKPESSYEWNSNRFVSSPTGPYPGHILNWACMSRADIAKKVLTGGKANVLGTRARLVSEGRQVLALWLFLLVALSVWRLAFVLFFWSHLAPTTGGEDIAIVFLHGVRFDLRIATAISGPGWLLVLAAGLVDLGVWGKRLRRLRRAPSRSCRRFPRKSPSPRA